MTTSGATAHNPLLRRWLWVVIGFFISNGWALGIWGGSLAVLRERAATDTGTIAKVLIFTGTMTIITMQFSGRYADRVGPVRPSIIGGGLIMTALALMTQVTSVPWFVVAALFMGVGNGVMDVAMNALAVDLEKQRRSPIMSRMHATWSIGGFLGAGFVLGVGSLFGPQRIVWTLAAAFLIGLAGLVATALLAPRQRLGHEVPGEGAAAPAAAPRGRVPAVAFLLGIMALCFGLTEGSAIDWASIHVTDVTKVAASVGAVGLVAVQSTMVLVRLVGDHVVTTFGRKRVVLVGSLVAAVSFLVVSTVDSLPLVVLGWALTGLGVGMIAPQIYALAGHLGGGRTLAVVTGFGYTAFLAGPGIIGLAIHAWGVQRAMVVPLALCLVVAALALTKALPDDSHGTVHSS